MSLKYEPASEPLHISCSRCALPSTWELGLGVLASGFGAQGSGFRIQGSGLMVT